MTKNHQYTVHESLKTFLKKVQQLKERELMHHTLNASWKLSISPETKELKIDCEIPNEDLLHSLCVDIRYFFLKKECGYIFRIYNLCQIYLTNEQHKKYLIQSKNILNSKMKCFGMNLTINEINCSPEFAFNTFINATFHHDRKSVNFLDNLNELQKRIFRIEVNGFIIAAINEILYLEKIVKHALDNNEIKNISDEIQ